MRNNYWVCSHAYKMQVVIYDERKRIKMNNKSPDQYEPLPGLLYKCKRSTRVFGLCVRERTRRL